MQSDTGSIAFNVHHIGAVVKDVEKTSKFLSEILGIGFWDIHVYSPSKSEMLIGEPFSLKTAHGKFGSVEIELLQPLKGDSIWGQFLETKGEGLHHIAFHNLSNWEEMVAKLQEQGSRMIIGASSRGTRWTYFDTPGGIIVELMLIGKQ